MILLRLLLSLCFLILPAYAEDELRFEYSRFYRIKDLVKEALEKETLRSAKYKKTKNLQAAVTSSLTGALLGIRTQYGIDFAVICSDINNSKELLDKDIMFVTVKLKYNDEKGQIMWELTSVSSPKEIDFYSVMDDGKEVSENDLYAYKRLYRQ